MTDLEHLSETVRTALSTVWAWLTVTAAPPSAPMVLALLCAGAALVGVGPLWRATRPLGTWTHEAGHAVAATLSGARITGLRMAGDGSGSLSYEGFAGTHTFVSAAGYPAASLLALVCACAVRVGYPRAAVALAALIVFVLALAARGIHSLLWTAVAVAATVGLVWAPVGVEAGLLLAMAGFAAAGGLRMAVEALVGRQDPGSVTHSDAQAISSATGLPARVVSGGFVVFAAAACVGVLVVSLPG